MKEKVLVGTSIAAAFGAIVAIAVINKRNNNKKLKRIKEEQLETSPGSTNIGNVDYIKNKMENER